MLEDASSQRKCDLRTYCVAIQLLLVLVAALAALYVDATASALIRLFQYYRIDDNLLLWVVAAIAWHRLTWLGPIVLLGIAICSLVAARRQRTDTVAVCLVVAVGVFVVTVVWSHLVVWAMYSQFYIWGSVV